MPDVDLQYVMFSILGFSLALVQSFVISPLFSFEMGIFILFLSVLEVHQLVHYIKA